MISASVESYAARVEYDIPLPAGPGSIGQITGEVRASAAGENAKGVAAAPSALGPVVGGKFSDPRAPDTRRTPIPRPSASIPGASRRHVVLLPDRRAPRGQRRAGDRLLDGALRGRTARRSALACRHRRRRQDGRGGRRSCAHCQHVRVGCTRPPGEGHAAGEHDVAGLEPVDPQRRDHDRIRSWPGASRRSRASLAAARRPRPSRSPTSTRAASCSRSTARRSTARRRCNSPSAARRWPSTRRPRRP